MLKSLIAVALLLSLTACEHDAQVISKNLSDQADNFEVTRRIVFYNGISGEYMPDGYNNPYDDPLFNKKLKEMVISSDTENDRKKKVAVAIAYDPGDTAPKIVASGKGNIADKIILIKIN
jgi:hypothetical protein